MWRKQFWNRPTKYGNQSTTYGGLRYDSQKEADYAAQLNLLKRAKEIQEWQPKPKYRLVVNDLQICTIIPDFLVINKDGEEEVHEVKSTATMTDMWRMKRKLFEALYPEITYRVIL